MRGCKKCEVVPRNNLDAFKKEHRGVQILSRVEVEHLLLFVLQSNVSIFNGRYYRQKDGIPAGLSPCSWLANLYCFMREYRFVKTHIQRNNSSILLQLKHVMRWTDDLLFLHCNVTEDLMATVQGIYPQQLKLIREQAGNRVHYLDYDIRIVPRSLKPHPRRKGRRQFRT